METDAAPCDRWLEEHPYLRQMARFVETIEAAATAGAQAVVVPGPRWELYAPEYARGVPLVRSPAWTAELAGAAAEALGGALDALAVAALPRKLALESAELREELRRAPEEWGRAMAWSIRGAPESGARRHGSLLTFLGWTAFRHAFAPVLQRFAAWRAGRPSMRGHCPTCGASPAMAQLAAAGEGAGRWLACGWCASRWRYQPIGCPYCGNDAPDRLGILDLEGEPRLRIDVCEQCMGYLKTYTGQGEEVVLLADWPTLHLDVLARERGFKRLGASLYESP